jgi:hypothetical protein
MNADKRGWMGFCFIRVHRRSSAADKLFYGVITRSGRAGHRAGAEVELLQFRECDVKNPTAAPTL